MLAPLGGKCCGGWGGQALQSCQNVTTPGTLAIAGCRVFLTEQHVATEGECRKSRKLINRQSCKSFQERSVQAEAHQESTSNQQLAAPIKASIVITIVSISSQYCCDK